MDPFSSSSDGSSLAGTAWQPVLPPTQTIEPVCCPLCDKPDHMRKSKPLYGTSVCKKCYYGFLNRRQGAYAIDWIIWWVVGQILSVLLHHAVLIPLGMTPASQSGSSSAPPTFSSMMIWGTLIALALGLLEGLIFCFKDGFRFGSPGKYLLGLTVLDDTTYQPIGFLKSFKRNLILMVPLIPLVIAFTMGKGPRLGDRWAKTRVVRIKQMGNPVFTGLLICRHCQYDLRGNTSGQCPECGTLLAPQQLETLASPPLSPPSPPLASE